MRASRFYCVIFLALSLPRAWGEPAPALSQKPTFQCERVQTTVARIICSERLGASADWELSAATWALRFSLDEPSQDAFVQGHSAWVQSMYGTCFLEPYQTIWFPH